MFWFDLLIKRDKNGMKIDNCSKPQDADCISDHRQSTKWWIDFKNCESTV